VISPSDEVCVRRDGSDDADNDPSQSMTETEQRLVVYGVGALGMLLCDVRARASLATPAAAADGVRGAVAVPDGALEVFRRTPDKVGVRRTYDGRLAKRALRDTSSRRDPGLPDGISDDSTALSSHIPLSMDATASAVSVSSTRALSYECLRIVGDSGYLTDDEDEHQLDECLPHEFLASRGAVRSMVPRDEDEIAGFGVLGILACAVPAARVSEAAAAGTEGTTEDLDSRSMAAHALRCVVSRGLKERDAFCHAGGVQWLQVSAGKGKGVSAFTLEGQKLRLGRTNRASRRGAEVANPSSSPTSIGQRSLNARGSSPDNERGMGGLLACCAAAVAQWLARRTAVRNRHVLRAGGAHAPGGASGDGGGEGRQARSGGGAGWRKVPSRHPRAQRVSLGGADRPDDAFGGRRGGCQGRRQRPLARAVRVARARDEVSG